MTLSIQRDTKESIRFITDTLNFPRSSFYDVAMETDRQAEDRKIGDLIEAIFLSHKGRYGYRRIVSELDDHGGVCAPERVRRIMRERGLKAIQPKRTVPVTSDGKASRPAPNLLEDKEFPTEENTVWTGDITYIPTVSGWIYMAVVIDLFSRRIIGWSLADNMRSELVIDALDQALQIRTPAANLIFHSDRGSQYGSGAFRDLLKNSGITQSMSGKANPYDNAWTESFMGTLKLEEVQDQTYADESAARKSLFEYIEAYYNTRRKHSSIKYMTPIQFENSILTIN